MSIYTHIYINTSVESIKTRIFESNVHIMFWQTQYNELCWQWFSHG